MVTRKAIEQQLKRLGIAIKSWGSAEINELQHILTPEESITGLVHGWYDNGFATLVATDQRLLLIDKKPFFLTVEDVRYDMIAEVDFNGRLVDATIIVNTINKTLRFTTFRQKRLRGLCSYVQQRVMQLRQPQFTEAQFRPEPKLQEPEPQIDWIAQAAGNSAAVPTMPAPAWGSTRRLPLNPYAAKPSFTTTHKFLPKIPRRR